MKQTDFDFGFNVRDPSNADPWGRSTGPDGARGATRKLLKSNASLNHPAHTGDADDSGPVEKSKNANENAIDIDFVCRYIKREIAALTKEVHKVAYLKGNNLDISELIKRGNGDSQGNLLHGSDVPAKTRSFKIKIKEFRQAPEGFKGAVGIVDIEEIFGCQAWALNKTNAKALATLLGNNTDKWKGKPVTLEKIKVQNPSKGTTVDSLAVQV